MLNSVPICIQLSCGNKQFSVSQMLAVIEKKNVILHSLYPVYKLYIINKLPD